MVILIYAFATLFIFMAMVMMFTYHRSPQRGVLLLGITYGVSAVVALVLLQAWPLFVGLLIAFGLRALGFDPAPRFREPPAIADEKPESEKRDQP